MSLFRKASDWLEGYLFEAICLYIKVVGTIYSKVEWFGFSLNRPCPYTRKMGQGKEEGHNVFQCTIHPIMDSSCRHFADSYGLISLFGFIKPQ